MEKEKLITLVTKAQNGDSEAKNTLFCEFYNVIYDFAYKTVKDENLACDITQETFLEILRTIGNLQIPEAFVSWAKKIAYHQCTRHFKKKQDILVDEYDDGGNIFDTIEDTDTAVIPQDIYEQDDLRITIKDMVDNLSEEQRSAVTLFYFDEMTIAKIAEIQAVSEGTVKSRLNYARKSLRKSVEAYEEKSGIRLHAIPLAPLFMLGFGAESVMPTSAFLAAQQAVSAAVAGAAATGTAAASAAAGTTVVAAKTGAGIGTKIIAGVVATTLAAGGIILGSILMKKDNPETIPEEPKQTIHYNMKTIAAGCDHIVAVKEDGTVVASGDNTYNQCDVDTWTDVIAVSANGHNTVALRSDGTVLATGDNRYNQCDVDDWTDIVEVRTSGIFTMGLKSDGTIVGTGVYTDPSGNSIDYSAAFAEVQDAQSIEAFYLTSMYIDKDGNVVPLTKGLFTYKPEQWQDVKNIYHRHSNDMDDAFAILSNDKTVSFKTTDFDEELDTSKWKSLKEINLSCIVTSYKDILSGKYYEYCCLTNTDYGIGTPEHTVMLTAVDEDGYVFFTGYNLSEEFNVLSEWTNVESVVSGHNFTAALHKDGTISLAGSNENIDVSNFKNIKVYD